MKAIMLGSIGLLWVFASSVSFSKEPPIFSDKCTVVVSNNVGDELNLSNKPTCTEIYELLKTPTLEQQQASMTYQKVPGSLEVGVVNVKFDRKITSEEADQVLNTLQLGPELDPQEPE